MFQAGDYIIYGTRGVCKITELSMKMNVEGTGEEMFYTLESISMPGITIYSPVDNTTVLKRYLIDAKEAEKLIHEIPEMEEVEIVNERQREQVYKNCVRSGSCLECARLIKTLYHRKQLRLARGKKMTATDERYLKLAEDTLYSELGHQMKKENDEIRGLFAEQLTGLMPV